MRGRLQANRSDHGSTAAGAARWTAAAFVGCLLSASEASAQLLATPQEPVVQAISRAASANHSCARSDDGTVRCWGLNSAGQAIFGSVGVQHAPYAYGFVPAPSPVDLSGVAQIAVGSEHSCALKNEGTVWCWGSNAYGQRGNGVPSPGYTLDAGVLRYHGRHSQTAEWVYALGDNTVSLTASGNHNCALINDGTVWCWGDNRRGQLGDGTTIDRNVPVQVVGLPHATAIGVGLEHTCAVSSASELWCWGNNADGQLGDGTRTNSLNPVRAAITGVTAVAGGIANTCARKGDGTLWCWGNNAEGQLGDGTTIHRMAPTRVGDLTDVGDFSVGFWHGCAVRSSDESVFCWGNDTHGQTGRNPPGTLWRPSIVTWPEQVKTAAGTPLRNVMWIGSGRAHSCAALNTSPAIWCWGSNGFGELGDGTWSSPYQISLLDDTVEVGPVRRSFASPALMR